MNYISLDDRNWSRDNTIIATIHETGRKEGVFRRLSGKVEVPSLDLPFVSDWLLPLYTKISWTRTSLIYAITIDNYVTAFALIFYV